MSTEICLSIPAMKCNGCVAVIDKVLSSQAGVVSAGVDLATRTARVEGDVSLPELLEALKAAGFEADGSAIAAGDSRV
jgi:copper chaperone CopZ